jgi:aspartate racemase
MKPATVGILGGMGPAAGAEFARMFVDACNEWLAQHGQPVDDQSFAPHWLAQLPMADRSAALLANGASPLPGMAAALRQLASVGARSVAIACNTAHAWHAELRAQCPQVELLHIVHETVRALRDQGVSRVGLLATLGTHKLRLYEPVLEAAGIRCFVPAEDEQRVVMKGIREGVKAGRMDLARDAFSSVGQVLAKRHGVETLVLACTEIPLALHALAGVRLVDPAKVLAWALVARACADGGHECPPYEAPA